MQLRVLLVGNCVGVSGYDIVEVRDQDVVSELLFVDAWEKGFVPLLGGCLRVRQIRRVWPNLTLKNMPPSTEIC